MKKNIISMYALLSLSFAYSQVGINTSTPQTTLDVNAKRDISGTIVDHNQMVGFQAPRMTRLELANTTATYGEGQKGALIFITDISGGTAAGQRINITSANNYYYFDGSLWQKITDINLYKDDGTLLSDRTVAQAEKTLAFTSTATTGTSHFTVDGTTLNVDAVNNRIGINNAIPAAKLDITGDSGTAPIRARNMESSESTVLAAKRELSPVMIDKSGVMVRQFTGVDNSGSYYFDGGYLLAVNGAPVDVVTGIAFGTIVKFDFLTNFSFGNSNSAVIYAEVTFSERRGFKVNPNWTHSGNTPVANSITMTGEGTNSLVFGDSFGTMTITYSAGKITAQKTGPSAAVNTNLQILAGYKFRGN